MLYLENKNSDSDLGPSRSPAEAWLTCQEGVWCKRLDVKSTLCTWVVLHEKVTRQLWDSEQLSGYFHCINFLLPTYELFMVCS